MPNKEEISALFSDRTVVISLLLVIILCIVLCGVALVGLKVSDIQLPVRYSDYGMTNTYRDKWYYLLSFPLLAILVAVGHTMIALKLLSKSRELTIGFLLISSVMLAFGIIVTAAVLHLVGVSA
jgi:hypothetical protein